DRLLLIETFLVGVGQLAEGRAGAIEQPLPAELAHPAAQPRLGDAGDLVVVEIVGDAVRLEPGPGLPDRVAIPDAVERDRHARPVCTTAHRCHAPADAKGFGSPRALP